VGAWNCALIRGGENRKASRIALGRALRIAIKRYLKD
jgi:hypothetical protein